jgi:hypothetical protein
MDTTQKQSGYLTQRRASSSSIVEHGHKNKPQSEGTAASNNSRKGRPNKNKKVLLTYLEAKFGADFSPVAEMCEAALRLAKKARDNPTDAVAQLDCVAAFDRIAKYVTPQLKAVDVTSGGEHIQFGFQLNLAQAVEQAKPIDVTQKVSDE